MRYWFELCRAGSTPDVERVPEGERTPLDEEHLAFSRRVKERGHSRIEPQLILIPARVEEALREWLRATGG